MIYPKRNYVFFYEAVNTKTGEKMNSNIGSQNCRQPMLTKKWRQLKSLGQRWVEARSEWSIVYIGVSTLEDYGHEAT